MAVIARTHPFGIVNFKQLLQLAFPGSSAATRRHLGEYAHRNVVVLRVRAQNLVASGASSRYRNHHLHGGWNPVKNINDSHVKEIANYAVTEHCKQSGAKLKLDKDVCGEQRPVAGVNYCLELAVKDGTATSTFDALVYDRPRDHFRELTSFEPLNQV